jgi:hypothetical protein
MGTEKGFGVRRPITISDQPARYAERKQRVNRRDSICDFSDLLAVFQYGEYEDAIDDNSTWSEGDWNGDGDFNSSDLVLALQSGYVAAALPTELQSMTPDRARPLASLLPQAAAEAAPQARRLALLAPTDFTEPTRPTKPTAPTTFFDRADDQYLSAVDQLMSREDVDDDWSWT